MPAPHGRLTVCAWLVLAPLLGPACTGAIGRDTTGDGIVDPGAAEPTPGGRPPAGGSPSGTPTAPGTPTGAPPVAPVPPPAAGDPTKAGPRPFRRLTRREYDNTIRDLLGDSSRPASQFPLDKEEGFTFRDAGTVAVQDATLLRNAAETVALNATPTLAKLAPCAAGASEPGCARKFIETFGVRAWRRPLAAAEVDRLAAIFALGRGMLKLPYDGSLALVVEAMLQAPAFLYHWESPAAPVTREGGLVRLGAYDVASRLSYFLWGSMPDETLFAAAAANKLGTPAEIESQARRMLQDPKARETLAAFAEDWLGLDALPLRTKDAKLYPEYTDVLQASMLNEARAFIAHAAFDGDARFATLLTAPFSFADGRLATIYTGTKSSATELARLDLPAAQRQGMLTQLGFLAATGGSDGSHPVRRGMAVLEKLLCRHLPPPPDEVPAVKPRMPGATTRERFAEHSTLACARACHEIIDPLGFAFEHYDGIGRYRTTDEGKPVDATGKLLLDGVEKRFANALEMSTQLSTSAEVERCFAAHWTRFALGRNDVAEDAASIDAATAALRREGGLRELLVAVATSRSFRYRSPSAGEVLP